MKTIRRFFVVGVVSICLLSIAVAVQSQQSSESPQLFPLINNLPRGMKQSIAVFRPQLAPAPDASVSQILLSAPTAIALSEAGELFILDRSSTRVVRVDASGNASVVFEDDGNDRSLPATYQALFSVDGKSALDSNGNLYLVDDVNHRVTRTSPDLQTETVAGTGVAGYTTGGGTAVLAQLDMPSAIALDVQGNIYILEAGNEVVRKVTKSGVITLVAGLSPDQRPEEIRE